MAGCLGNSRLCQQWECTSVGQNASVMEDTPPLLRGTLPLLTQPAIAEATHHNRETPPQGRAHSNGADPTPAGQGPGRQIETRLPPTWAG